MSKERIIPNPDGTDAEHLYGRKILYGDGQLMKSVNEGCARQMKYEAGTRWTRVLKPLTERKEKACKKVAAAVKAAQANRKPKKKTSRRSKRKPL